MPSTIWEDTVTDSGSASLGGSRVLYVAWEITAAGPGVRNPSSWDLHTQVGVGFWQLGNDLTALGLISGIGWSEPHWIFSEIGQWIAPPGLVGADFSYALAGSIQWVISPGTEVHMYVFGDT
jgi:hypothetical protein